MTWVLRWVLLALLSIGCTPKTGQSCGAVAAAARPKVIITWTLQHGSIDDDPPRAKVTLAFSGAVKANIELGQLFGQCKLAVLGALPEQPANGSKVTEIECPHGVRTQYATVVLVEPGKLVVRRSERVDESMKERKDIDTIEVPACASFASELAQGGGEL